MAKILQKFDYQESFYQRPNQEWRCGLTPEGKPCHIGPNSRGHCQATYECRPARQNDRWKCTKSMLGGGACEPGPSSDGTCIRPIPKCRPIRSWRGRLRVMSRLAGALTFGLLLIFLGGSRMQDSITPGELTFQHSSVQSCADCHSVFDGGPMAWISAAFTENSELADSILCIGCHKLGVSSLDPHGMPARDLEKITKGATKSSSPQIPWTLKTAAFVTEPKHAETGILPCMTCHQEHRGKSKDLKEVSNFRCMICHESKFQSFSQGHPEFVKFPFNRRTRIAFDHASHFKTHFQDKSFQELAPFGCNDCHEPDRVGESMLTKGFDVVCAACHENQIEGFGRATEKGIEIFTLPGLDVESLIELEIAIGGWPIDAEDEMTPFMNFLLSPDPEFRAARAVLEDMDLMDLVDAEPEQLKAVETLAWAVKGLFAELSAKGMPALRLRLEAAMGREIGTADLAGLGGQMPVDAVRAAGRAWFPALHGDMAAHREGKPVPIPDEGDATESEEPIEGQASGEDWSSAGGWYVDEFSLRYRPIGHKDQFLTAWLNISGTAATKAHPSAGRDVFELLADPKAPGRCAKCHSIDAVGAERNRGFIVNWTGIRPVKDEQKFTKFSHISHFSLLEEEGCLLCHSLNAEAKTEEGFKDRNPATFESNFSFIERKTCKTCHTEKEAGDRCLTCHKFHIGVFPRAMTSAPEVMTKKPPN